MSICQSWVDQVGELCPCNPEDFGEGQAGVATLERWALIASSLLYAKTGRRFPGVCSDTVWPCQDDCGVQWLAYATGGARPLGCCTSASTSGRCVANAIRLPRRARAITEVLIDGVALDPAGYRLVDQRLLVRVGGTWPHARTVTDDTLVVTYTYGQPPPAGGREVAAIYACELAKGCAGDDSCRLPRRVQSITREGVSMAIIDPFDFFEHGLTGLYEVDAWVTAHNPHRLDRAGKVLNPDLLTSHRVL